MKQARDQAAARWHLQLSGEVRQEGKEKEEKVDQQEERKPLVLKEVIVAYLYSHQHCYM